MASSPGGFLASRTTQPARFTFRPRPVIYCACIRFSSTACLKLGWSVTRPGRHAKQPRSFGAAVVSGRMFPPQHARQSGAFAVLPPTQRAPVQGPGLVRTVGKVRSRRASSHNPPTESTGPGSTRATFTTTLPRMHPLIQPTRTERIRDRAIDLAGATIAILFLAILAGGTIAAFVL